MSGVNTKASKIDRILQRQSADTQLLIDISEQQVATIALLTGVADRLEAENARLRKYLGSVLFKRRRLESASDVAQLLEPRWGGR
jgi:hypothetical protein